MSIYVRPINKDDVRNISSGRVTMKAPRNFKSGLTGTICDPLLFGPTREHKQNKNIDNEDVYCRTATISLTVPVLNPFLAGADAKAWHVVLKRSIAEVKDIVYGRIAYNQVTEEWLNRNDLENVRNSEEIIFGGNLLRFLIRQVDIEERIKDALYKEFIVPQLDRLQKKDYLDNGTMLGSFYYSEDEPVDAYNHVFDFYYFQPLEGFEYLLDDLNEYIYDNSADKFKNQFANLTILLAYKQNPRNLEDQIMDDIFVLPYGYRANIEERIDPLNRQYNKLVSLNTELAEDISYQGVALRTIMVKYEEIVKYITNIFVGDDDISRYAGNSYKSIKDMLAGKQGLMRSRMQGVRIDYSGRTVITCDPNMSMDHIGVPKKILPKLLELGVIQRYRDLPKYSQENLSYLHMQRYRKDFQRKANELAEDMYMVIGRQPTLFNLGMQAFKVIPIDGDAISLSPLVVMPFNADFDGDQMHETIAISEEAKLEVAKLIASTNNVFYPRDGSLTVVTRHEIQYGLWVASKVTDKEGARTLSVSDIEALKEKYGMSDNVGLMAVIFHAVCNQDIAIYDKVPISGKYQVDGKYNSGACPAGIAAIKYALGKTNSEYAIGVKPVAKYSSGATDKDFNPKWFQELLSTTTVNNTKVFVEVVDRVVKLGFSVAKIWPPGISTINTISIEDKVTEFNNRIAKREQLLHKGIEIESAFSDYFESELKKLQKEVEDLVVEELGPDNGYVKMWKSGAKGSLSNIMQEFGIKGRIMKNSIVAFDTIIGNSLSNQLTSLEHFITAYGGRQGLSDKVLATAEPGYLTRKIEHACPNIVIRAEDCGVLSDDASPDGIRWTYKDIIQFIDEIQYTGNPLNDIFNVRSLFAPTLVGRNVVIYNKDANGEVVGKSDMYVSNGNQALVLFDQYVGRIENGEFIEGDGIVVRSPITCHNPVCQKCYGRDTSTNMRYPRIGKPVGFVAAQSVGELSTQLTMKVFQTGGVKTEANLTSSYQKISEYLGLTDIKKKDGANTLLPYDALSRAEGYVRTVSTGDGRKRIYVVDEEGNNLLGLTKYFVHEDTVLKDYVKKGDSFQKVQGDLNIREVLKYRGYEDAYKYLIFKMFKIFNDESAVSLKHFETIVASLASFVLLTNCFGHTAGEMLSLPELWNLAQDGAVGGVYTILGLGELPKYRSDFFESMIMENMGTYVPRAILTHPVDEMKNPKTRLSFGLNIGIGSDYAEFME